LYYAFVEWVNATFREARDGFVLPRGPSIRAPDGALQ
jgi:hypothetical protein